MVDNPKEFAKSKGADFYEAYQNSAIREVDLLAKGWSLPTDTTILRCASCCRTTPIEQMDAYNFFGDRKDLVCKVCSLKRGALTYWMDLGWGPPQEKGPLLPIPATTNNPPTQSTTAIKNTAKPPTPPTPAKTSFELTDSVRETFNIIPCRKPSGHQDLLLLNTLFKQPDWGGFILSSSRLTDAHADVRADACIFLDQGWRTKWHGTPAVPATTKKVHEQLAQGTNGLEWPDLEVEIPGKPAVIDKISDGPVIYLPWTDGTAPVMEIVLPYVEQAAEFIKQGKIVQVGCIGGHGRTGTFAALVLVTLLPKLPATAAINMLRKAYCSKALETISQEDSIFKHTGEEVPPSPAKFRSSYGGYYGGQGQTQGGYQAYPKSPLETLYGI